MLFSQKHKGEIFHLLSDINESVNYDKAHMYRAIDSSWQKIDK